MTYKLEQIEGIGPHYSERLAAVGVRTSAELMHACATEQRLDTLAQRSGISPTLLTAWAHQADLMRVKGIGSEYGQLLEASGIETVEFLSGREPENVVNLIHRVNAEKKLTRAVPSAKVVARWVQHARDMVRTARTSADEVSRSPSISMGMAEIVPSVAGSQRSSAWSPYPMPVA